MINWKSVAIEKLKRYNLQKTSIATIPDEIAVLESEAASIKGATSDGTPVKGGGSRREDRLLDNIVEREELKRQLERNKTDIKIVDRGLATLSREDKHILQEMYINGGKGGKERLMGELGLSEESSLYKKANKALWRFTIALYGSIES